MSFFSFHGRIGRSSYWKAIALCAILFAGAAAMIVLGGGGPLGIVGFLVVAANAWASLATSVTRLHDMNRSGFYAFLALVPGGALILLAVCGLRSGTPGMNRYGPPPGLGTRGSLDEAMAAFEEPDVEEHRVARSRQKIADTAAARPGGPLLAAAATTGWQHARGPIGRRGFGRRNLFPA